MQGAVLYGPRDVRFEERDDPTILEPTDAIIRISATCVCGSDLWPYRGHQPIDAADADGARVLRHRRGGRQRGPVGQARPVRHRLVLRVRQHLSQLPGRLPVVVRAPRVHRRARRRRCCACRSRTARWWRRRACPPDDLIPSLLTTSDVLGTGWFAADAANVKPGTTVVVVGDGAVGLLGVLSAKQMGAERIIAMSRHEARQKLAREFGATDIVTERGDEGVARIKDLTNGIGADSVLECVGTQESMMQAIRSTRPGGYVGYVGVPHGVELDGEELFFTHVHLHGGPAPVRRYLPELIDLVWNGKINPGKVFDLTLPLDQVAEGYRAMDERRAIKALLLP